MFVVVYTSVTLLPLFLYCCCLCILVTLHLFCFILVLPCCCERIQELHIYAAYVCTRVTAVVSDYSYERTMSPGTWYCCGTKMLYIYSVCVQQNEYSMYILLYRVFYLANLYTWYVYVSYSTYTRAYDIRSTYVVCMIFNVYILYFYVKHAGVGTCAGPCLTHIHIIHICIYISYEMYIQDVST